MSEHSMPASHSAWPSVGGGPGGGVSGGLGAPPSSAFGTADLVGSLDALMHSGPSGAVSVNTQPLYDAVLTLFSFAKQQAAKQASDSEARRTEVEGLQEVVARQAARIDELEKTALNELSLPQLRAELDGAVAEFRSQQAYADEEAAAAGQEMRNLNARVTESEEGLRRSIASKLDAAEFEAAMARGVPALVSAGVAPAARDVEVLREQTAAQLKELALHVNSVAARAAEGVQSPPPPPPPPPPSGVTPEQLEAAEKRVEGRILSAYVSPLQEEVAALGAEGGRAGARVKGLGAALDEQEQAWKYALTALQREAKQMAVDLDGVMTTQQARARQPQPPSRAEFEGLSDRVGDAEDTVVRMRESLRALSAQPAPAAATPEPPVAPSQEAIQEAFTVLTDRLGELEENKDEQDKAAVVISQYFDKLDHLYALLGLDKRTAAYGASLQEASEKAGILLALPAFQAILRQLRGEGGPGAREVAVLLGLSEKAVAEAPAMDASRRLGTVLDAPAFLELRRMVDDVTHNAKTADNALHQALQELAGELDAVRRGGGGGGAPSPGSGRLAHRNVSPLRSPPQQPAAAPPGRGPPPLDGGDGGGGDSRAVAEAGVELADAQGGASVTAITPGGPCFNAGWRVGDHVVSVDSAPLLCAADFAHAVQRAAHSGSVAVSRIPVGNYRPVSGLLVFSSTPAQQQKQQHPHHYGTNERSWH